ncbi:MAG: type IV pilus secretin PilQ [Cycloclasticus sp.]|nr:type IV pilus secretin PilQ [Cycloclasticus sp.]
MKQVNKGKFMHKLMISGWGVKKLQKEHLIKALFVMTCWVSMSLVTVNAAVLKDIQFSGLPGNKVQIELALDSAPGQLKSFSTDNPARIAIDMEGVSNAAGKATIPINIGSAISVRALEAGGKTRVVLNLSNAAPYATKVVGNSVFLTLGNVPTRSVAVAEASQSGMASNAIDGIDFRRGEEGEGRVLVSLNNASAVVDVKEEGGKVIIEIKDTSVTPALANRLDVLDFATPVKTIDVKPSGKNTRLSITPIGAYEFLSYQMDELLTVEFKPLTKQEQEDLAAVKFPFTGEKLSLNFQSIEVRSVLQLLADFTDMNLVASDSVSGNVTLRLNNVPWDQALDIILKSKGLAKRITGNVMMVGPQAEVAAQEKLELEAKKQVTELSPLETEFFSISYAKASELATVLKSAGGGANNRGDKNERLISSRGGVSVDVRTNTLLVQETADKLVEIRRIIEQLDRPIRQVMIESRIVIANDDFTRDLGVRFGIAGIDQSNDSISAVTGGIDEGFTDATVGIEDFGGMVVDLPAANPAGAVHFLVGKIGSSLLQLELSALQTEAKGEVISSPRVITSDQIEASISQGVQIPYQEASSSGATSTSFQDAFLELKVTPRITPDDRINMELSISKDEADRSTIPPAINVQEVKTTVLVDNGNTVILGGIYERTKSNGVKKVPFFGDLPGVGVLFRNTTKTDNNRELLFFITPKILKENLRVN